MITNKVNYRNRKLQIALERERDKILTLVQDRYVYLDTVVLLFPFDGLTNDDIDWLRQSSGSENIIYHRSFHGWYRLTLQRPGENVLNYLNEFYPIHTVSRVDCAVDFIVSSEATLRKLKIYFDHRFSMLWHSKRRVKQTDQTTYMSGKGSGRNVAIYNDKISKVTEEMALHLEFRWDRASTCKNIGIYGIRDLIGFNPIPHMCRQSRLSALCWRKLTRNLNKFCWKYVQSLKSIPPWRWDFKTAQRRFRTFLIKLSCPEGIECSFEELEKVAMVQVLLDLGRPGKPMYETIAGAAVHIKIDPLILGVTLISPLGETQTA
jgi:hypothetical protein